MFKNERTSWSGITVFLFSLVESFRVSQIFLRNNQINIQMFEKLNQKKGMTKKKKKSKKKVSRFKEFKSHDSFSKL